MKTKLLILGAVSWLMLFLPLSAIEHLDLITILSGEFYGSWFGTKVVAMDFNGDGHDDLIVHSPAWNPEGVFDMTNGWGRIYFYWGGPGFNNVADYIMTASHLREFYSQNIFNGGDINGDGIDDMVLTLHPPTGKDQIAVYYGGPSPSGTPDLLINPRELAEDISPRPLGDINGDGHADLAIHSSLISAGIVRIFAWTGIDDPWHELASIYHSECFLTARLVGDVNGDGYADYVLQSGVPGGDNSNVRIALYYGGLNFPQVDSLVISDNTYQVLGSKGGCPLGDLNNDGYNDFTAYNGRIWYGGSDITPVNDLTINYYTQQHQWSSLTYKNSYEMEFIYGDLNGDGYDDAIASNAYIGFYNGEVGIWLGGPNMNGNCKLYLEPPADYGHRNYGWSKAMGDFNGDGLCDLAVSAPYWGQIQDGFLTEGRVYVYSGNTELVGNEDLLVPQYFDSSWQIDVFPNPFAGGNSIKVDFKGDAYKHAKQITLELYNLKGQKIDIAIVSNPNSTYELPNQMMSSLSAGLYIIAVHNDTKNVFKKKVCVIK